MDYQHYLTRPYFDDVELEYVKECLNSGWVTQGPMTKRFEQLFMEKHGGDYGIAVCNCTAGLHMAMVALGIGEGDEVIVPAYTWVTSANCVEYTGARVVLADVDSSKFNIDPEAIRKAISPRTKGIVVVHEFGCAAEMDKILEIVKEYNLFLIEDCACAIGTKYNGQPVGTFGDIGVFSFHPRKVITTGEGGMCITKDPKIAKLLDQLRNHGMSVDERDQTYGAPFYMGHFNILGYNFRLSDIQAAIGVAQMEKLETLVEERRKCAYNYIKLLKDCHKIILPETDEKYGPTFQSFVILLKPGMEKVRNSAMLKLQKQGIQTKQGTHAVHRLKYYKEKYGFEENAYPVSAYCEDCSITLPIYPGLKVDSQEEIVSNLLESLK